MDNTTELYFAYGSNLNTAQMHERIRRQDIEELGMAILPDYRIVERRYADIEEAPGQCVYGIVYKLTMGELLLLDIREGYNEGRASLLNTYERKRYTVLCNNERVDVWSYEVTPKKREERNGIQYPDDYRQRCSDGAEEHGLPNAFLIG